MVVFNTLYVQDVLDAIRSEGRTVTEEAAAHLSPALLYHINPYGSYTFDVERELQRTGHRPLRPARPTP